MFLTQFHMYYACFLLHIYEVQDLEKEILSFFTIQIH
jgi:hypothetical protein